MSLRATEVDFSGPTTPIGSYNSAQINLGTLMMQNSGPNPEDNFVGPLVVDVARPWEENALGLICEFPQVVTFSSTIDWIFLIELVVGATKRIMLYEYNKLNSTYSWKGFISATFPNATNITRGFRVQRYQHITGTVGVGAPTLVVNSGTVAVTIAGVVTCTGATPFLVNQVGMMIGFGSSTVSQISNWCPITYFTDTSHIGIGGSSVAFAAGTAYCIASCTVTGDGTKFQTERIAAGTSAVTALTVSGPRIGFGSTNPTQITNWYQIGFITSDTLLNLTTSPSVIASGTPYVIEELRFAVSMTNTTAANGGMFVVKGVGYYDFTTGGVTFPSVATTVDNQKGTYWLDENGSGGVLNQTANGCAVEATESSDKLTHWAYVLAGTNTSNAVIYKYNLRATGTIVSGKMQLVGVGSIVYTGTQAVTGTIPNNTAGVNNGTIATMGHGPGANNPYLYFVTTSYNAGTVTVTSGAPTTVTGSSTAFTAAMVGLRIGFGSTNPALITSAWVTISAYSSATSITVATSPGVYAAGSAYVIDAGRLYCAALGFAQGSTTFISTADPRQEIPPGGITTFPATGNMQNVEYISTIDRLVITTLSGAAYRSYVTRYPDGDNTYNVPFDHIFGIDDKQQDQSLATTLSSIHFSSSSQLLSAGVGSNGVVHIISIGASQALLQMYCLPFGAHWTYASSTQQRIITPSVNTTGCVKFDQVFVTEVEYLGGSAAFALSTDAYRVYYRTANIGVDATSSWTLLGHDGDLSAVSPANAIQFMFEFFIIGLLCLPARLLKLMVTYEDGATDSHYQMSALSNPATGPTANTFVWRFCQPFGGTVPTLKLQLFRIDTGASIPADTTTTSVNGTWSKSTTGGGVGTWGAYDTNDKTNETTYISYTPTSITDGLQVMAVLTQN